MKKAASRCPKAVLQEWLLRHEKHVELCELQQAAREVPAQGTCAWSHHPGTHRKTKSRNSGELFSRTVDGIAADGNKNVYQTEKQYVLLQDGQGCTEQGSTGIFVIQSNRETKSFPIYPKLEVSGNICLVFSLKWLVVHILSNCCHCKREIHMGFYLKVLEMCFLLYWIKIPSRTWEG